MGSCVGMGGRGRRVRDGVAWVALVVLGFGVTGCERDPTGRDGTLATGEFIEIIVALRTAEQEVEREVHEDSVAVEYERRKSAILERYDASEADLHRYLEEHHARPGVMAAVWDSITQRLRTPAEELGDIPPLEDGW